MLVLMKDSLTDLCGHWLLQNDFINTFCEINSCMPFHAGALSFVFCFRPSISCLGLGRIDGFRVQSRGSLKMEESRVYSFEVRVYDLGFRI